MSVNLGRVAYVEKGAYDGDTTYQKKDVVSYNNGSYVYIADVAAAGIVPTDTAYWQPMMNPEAMNRAAEAANKAAEAATAAVPNLRKELDGKAPAILVDATSDMVHITDGAAMPVQSIVTVINTASGVDSVSVTRAGKNLLNPAHFMNTTEADGVYTFSRTGYYANLYTAQNGSAHVIAASDFYKLPVLDAGEYILTQKVTSGGVFSLYAVATDGTKSALAGEELDTGIPRKSKYTVKARTMVCLIRTTNGNPTVFSEMMLEKSSTATGFEPYNGETLTAALPETVTEGAYDWLNGVLTKADGSTIQLTPQQLETLKGTNNIWSDAGATEVTYAADTGLYIEQKMAVLAAADNRLANGSADADEESL